jgi:hypothetical protein
MTVVGEPPPFRIAFDNARDPYTARNALGVTSSGVTAATPPLLITGGTISLDTAAAIAAIAPAWTAYTPTISALTGTLAAFSASGKYLTIGKQTSIQIEILITTNGTAGVFLLASLPNTATGLAILAGRETAIVGKALTGTVGNMSNTTVLIINYDNTYPGGDGHSLVLSGVYENT